MSSEPVTPQLVMSVMDEKLGLIGHLVVDSIINGHSAGGVRVLPDVTVDELVHLARNMTLKFGFLGIPLGGAKSCVFASPTLQGKGRTRLFTAFGRVLAPLIKSGVYVPGCDMGVCERGLQSIYAAAGSNADIKEVKSHVYASWTVFASAKIAAEHVGLDLSGSKVAIEGFGKVGGATAQIFADAGAKIVAISTLNGAMYDQAGLDVSRLLELKGKSGDNLVNEYEAQKIEKSDLLCLPVDVLIPCARPWTINSSNVRKIKAKIVCPGANVPMTMEAEGILRERKILCVPDFVSNSGGVLGCHLESVVSEGKIKEIVKGEFSKRVLEIVRLSEEKNVTPGQVAREIAIRRFNETKKEAERDLFQTDLIKSVFKLLPKPIKKALAPVYIRTRLNIS